MEQLENLCDTPLWVPLNANVAVIYSFYFFQNYIESRNASFPTLTLCFQNTICPAVPFLFVLLFTPFLVAYCTRNHDPPLQWTKCLIYKVVGVFLNFSLLFRLAINVLLQFLTCTAVLLSLVQLYLVVDGWLPNFLSYYLSGMFTFFTMVRFASDFPSTSLLFQVDILVLTLLCRSKGVVSSGVIHITWPLVVVSNLPQLLWWIQQFKLQSVRTKTIGNQLVKGYFQDLSLVPCGPVRFAVFIFHFLTSLQLLVLHCFADVHETTGYEDLTNTNDVSSLLSETINE